MIKICRVGGYLFKDEGESGVCSVKILSRVWGLERVYGKNLLVGCDARCLPMHTKSNVISRENDRDCWIKWARLPYKSIAFSLRKKGHGGRMAEKKWGRGGGMWCLLMVCRGKREWGLGKGLIGFCLWFHRFIFP